MRNKQKTVRRRRLGRRSRKQRMKGGSLSPDIKQGIQAGINEYNEVNSIHKWQELLMSRSLYEVSQIQADNAFRLALLLSAMRPSNWSIIPEPKKQNLTKICTTVQRLVDALPKGTISGMSVVLQGYYRRLVRHCKNNKLWDDDYGSSMSISKPRVTFRFDASSPNDPLSLGKQPAVMSSSAKSRAPYTGYKVPFPSRDRLSRASGYVVKQTDYPYMHGQDMVGFATVKHGNLELHEPLNATQFSNIQISDVIPVNGVQFTVVDKKLYDHDPDAVGVKDIKNYTRKHFSYGSKK